MIRLSSWLGTEHAHRDTGRVVAFSDGVFAITITLLVLEIEPPDDYGHLLNELLGLWPSYLAYAVTFLFIGQVSGEPPRHVRPHPCSRPRRAAPERTAVVFYGVAFGVTALTFNGVWQYASRQGLLSESLDRSGATAIGRRFQLAGPGLRPEPCSAWRSPVWA